MATTVKDFTHNEQTELKFIVNDQLQGAYITTLKELLTKCMPDKAAEISLDCTNELYDLKTEQMVMEFQKKYNFTVNGIVEDNVLNAIISVADAMPDIIYSENAIDVTTDSEVIEDPHFNAFFSSNNTKVTRKNQQDIVIELGNASIKKTLHNVYIRSVSVEYDTSGNPISEICEFVAQDLTESDEIKDKNKYRS